MTAPVGERSDYQFEWDEKKNRQNIRKHGFDFVDAEEMFCGILLFSPDVREDYGEPLGWDRHDSRPHCGRGLYRTWTRDHSRHFAKKGNPS